MISSRPHPFDRFGEAFAILADRLWLALHAANRMAADLASLLFRLARAWRREFVHLMRSPEASFPGRHDKLVWILLLLILPPVGAWTYRAYRIGRDCPAKSSGVDDFGELA